jgi:hypothetical protein
LTSDEYKAAEAAFSGRPFNPAWSQAARAVYDGIWAAMGLARGTGVESHSLMDDTRLEERRELISALAHATEIEDGTDDEL